MEESVLISTVELLIPSWHALWTSALQRFFLRVSEILFHTVLLYFIMYDMPER